MTEYQYPIGVAGPDSGDLVIAPDPMSPDRWHAIFVRDGYRREFLSVFCTPEDAATAIGTFRTGNPLWDVLKRWGFLDPQQAMALCDLKNWTRPELS